MKPGSFRRTWPSFDSVELVYVYIMYIHNTLCIIYTAPLHSWKKKCIKETVPTILDPLDVITFRWHCDYKDESKSWLVCRQAIILNMIVLVNLCSCLVHLVCVCMCVLYSPGTEISHRWVTPLGSKTHFKNTRFPRKQLVDWTRNLFHRCARCPAVRADMAKKLSLLSRDSTACFPAGGENSLGVRVSC